jgi:hypothetical protein
MQFKKKEEFWQDEKPCSFLWRSKMILYKYRSLANLEHVLDIILNQRLYCSTYPELNDPFEGLFVITTTITIDRFLKNKKHPLDIAQFPPIEFKSTKEVKDLFDGTTDKVKICSLSSDLNDVRLWSYYADGHKGIVFEIDFSGLEKIYEVKYSEELPSIEQLNLHELLSRKTNHWKFESEYRIIEESKDLAEGKYFDIKSKIKAIYLGTRTTDSHRELVRKVVGDKFQIWTTRINHGKIIVERDKLIEGREESPQQPSS